MLTDFYAHYYTENPNGEEWVDDDFEAELEEFQRECADGTAPRVTP